MEKLDEQIAKFNALSTQEQLRVLHALSDLMDDNRIEAMRLCEGSPIHFDSIATRIRELSPHAEIDNSTENQPERKYLQQQYITPRYIGTETREAYFAEIARCDPGLYTRLCDYLQVEKLTQEHISDMNGFSMSRTYTLSAPSRKNVVGDGADAYYFHTSPNQATAVRFSVRKGRRKSFRNFEAKLSVTNLFTNESLNFFNDDPVTSINNMKGEPIIRGSNEYYCLDADFIATKLQDLATTDPKYAQWDLRTLLKERYQEEVLAADAIMGGGDPTREVGRIENIKLGSLPSGEGFIRVFEELPLEENATRFAKSGDLAQLLADPRCCNLDSYNDEPITHLMPFSGKSRK